MTNIGNVNFVQLECLRKPDFGKILPEFCQNSSGAKKCLRRSKILSKFWILAKPNFAKGVKTARAKIEFRNLSGTTAYKCRSSIEELRSYPFMIDNWE
jgi:hypothetical protein